MLPPDRPVVTVLTMITVDPDDPAFANPTKFVGPGLLPRTPRRSAGTRRWAFRQDGAAWRRVVPSPSRSRSSRSSRSPGCSSGDRWWSAQEAEASPRCAPPPAAGELSGVEAVIDKDLASELLSEDIGADLFVMATDVDGVYLDWGTPAQRRLGEVTPEDLTGREFAAGSMGPKVDAAVRFVAKTGRRAAIGSLADIPGIVAGTRRHEHRRRVPVRTPRTRRRALGGRGAASDVSNLSARIPGLPERQHAPTPVPLAQSSPQAVAIGLRQPALRRSGGD